MTKLVILDRDGVINFDSPDFIRSPEAWIPIPGSLEAIADLNQAGIQVAITTNQSGIARKLYTLSTLHCIHEKMNQALHAVSGHIDALFVCPHGPWDHCLCRKPKPGLIQAAMQHFNIPIDEQGSVLYVGDSLCDLEAAQMAGCCPLLVQTGKGMDTANILPMSLKNTESFKDLAAIVSQRILFSK